MGTRGKKSVAELLIAEGPNGVLASRPDAPYCLTDAEADEWVAIVGSMRPGYFARSHYPMLSQLCRHVVASNRVAQLIEAICKRKKIDCAELASLLAMQSAESANIVRLCRQLRLSHQAIYRPDSIKQRPVGMLQAPWERGEED
jgi:hypothetical protein